MKIIHCNLWGDIEFSELAISIIDTPHFQRLHYIKQTGMAYKVFPSAMTTRFQHSLGVYNVTKMLLTHLINNQPELLFDCDKNKQELICIAGLIHDLGHGPYSHLFDSFLNKNQIKNGWENHENRSLDLFHDLIKKYNINISNNDFKFIESLVKGNEIQSQWYNHLINNKISGIDTDKMDYVLRDSTNFGMKIFFDPSRIIKNSRIIDDELCFCDRIKDEIITIFLIRNKMNRFIYRHSKICEFENALINSLDYQNSNDIINIIHNKNIDEFIKLNDYTFLFNYISLNQWTIYECRKLKYNDNSDSFKDKQWEKIKNIKFYSRKNSSHKYLIKEWTIISCFN